MVALRGAKILLVEDESFWASLYADTFEREGCTVLHAGDGEQGLELAGRHAPDVILLDILMPKMDGFETLRRLKLDPRVAGTPVIMCTNLAEKESIVRCLKGGAADYVIKARAIPSDMVRRVKRILHTA